MPYHVEVKQANLGASDSFCVCANHEEEGKSLHGVFNISTQEVE